MNKEQKKKQQQIIEDSIIANRKDIGDNVCRLCKFNNDQVEMLKKTLNESIENSAVYLKGRSLVRLACYDFCLYRYPFYKKYDYFDYEGYVTIYLQNDRYVWLSQDLLSLISTEYGVNILERDTIQLIYILSGIFTTQPNNQKRQQSITDLRKILFYIFELNFICTSFSRPSFNPVDCNYADSLNALLSKLYSTLPILFEIKYENMKGNTDGSFTFSTPIFKSWFRLFDSVEIISLGETNKKFSKALLAREILILISLIKDSYSFVDIVHTLLQLEAFGINNSSPKEDIGKAKRVCSDNVLTPLSTLKNEAEKEKQIQTSSQ